MHTTISMSSIPWRLLFVREFAWYEVLIVLKICVMSSISLRHPFYRVDFKALVLKWLLLILTYILIAN